MSSVVWPISSEFVEQLIESKYRLDSPVRVWAAGFDEVGSQVCIILEVDECDVEKLGIEREFLELDEGDLIQ